MTVNPWFLSTTPAADTAIRLYCFHHAGGSAQIFRNWDAALPGIEVCPIQLPGRWERIAEPPFTRLSPLLDAFTPLFIEHSAGKPFALYGHSLGGLLAFELALRLRRLGARLPAHLFLSGRRAPDAVRTSSIRLHTLPDREFVQAIAEFYEPLPSIILDDPEMRALFLRTLRADLELFETYAYQPEPPLPVPISAFAGDDDRFAGPRAVEGWREHTARAFVSRTFSGRHFFVREHERELLRLVASTTQCAA